MGGRGSEFPQNGVTQFVNSPLTSLVFVVADGVVHRVTRRRKRLDRPSSGRRSRSLDGDNEDENANVNENALRLQENADRGETGLDNDNYGNDDDNEISNRQRERRRRQMERHSRTRSDSPTDERHLRHG